MQDTPKQFSFTKLNLDLHPSLLSNRDLVYMLNGSVEGVEGSGNNYYVQNQLSNELCAAFPPGFEYVGAIPLNKFEYAIFLANGSISQIGLLNSNTCTYTEGISSECLNLDPNFPVRGVYKENNKDNDRRLYWVDGKNYNRYLDFDKMMAGDFPQTHLGSLCDDCNVVETGFLDCNKIRFNKEFRRSCLTIEPNQIGVFPTGTYQVAVAWSEDGINLTDFYFSDIVKVQSYKEDIGFEVNIDCRDNPFSQFNLILVSQTKENGLVIYDYGHYELSVKKITLSSLVNATVIDSSLALSKRVVYDKSQHIVTNTETLLLGKHQTAEPINYQPLANQIAAGWVEKKVPRSKAHLYPTFLRDEVYALAIEWKDPNGVVRGVFPIPGRAINNFYEIEWLGITYHEGDQIPPSAFVYETGDCDSVPTRVWQIENTATVLVTSAASCEECTPAPAESKAGFFGYYETESIKYPNDPEVWGALACQPVRHHRFPSHNLSHIHNQAVCTETIVQETYLDDDGNEQVRDVVVRTYEEDPCINILGVRLENVQKPLDENGNPVEGIWTYRVLYSRREGNKSILHKGLIFNVFRELASGEEIYYPNYPYNDLNPDEFISTSQTGDQNTDEQHHGNSVYSQRRFTYHSPDIHFREARNEFGTEVKLYTEEVGKIQGDFKPYYRHPQTAIDANAPDLATAYQNAQQFNSVANYGNYNLVNNALFFDRRHIDYSQYLLPIKQIVDDGNRFNNHLRETAYYFKIDADNLPIFNPFLDEDFSRIRRGMIECRDHISYCDTAEINEIDKDIQAVSYYVGIKQKQPDQYGQLDRIRYTPIEHCENELEDIVAFPRQFYGGDVYISKHSVLRKMPLFLDPLYDVPFDTSIDYRTHRNIYYPRYWYDNLSEADDRWRFDCWVGDIGPNEEEDGYFYIWVTGNLYFWGESEFIGDYREMDFTPQSRFYPKIDYNDVARADTIDLQQTFLYDFSLLNSSLETAFQTTLTKSDADFTVTYSLKNDLQSAGDNWLKFLPLNYTILPRTHGEFTGMHYVDQYSIWFIFENQILATQEDSTLQTAQGENIFVGQGDLFTRRLKKLSNEETGYTGSVDPFSFKNTRYGTFYFDRYRKKFFHWAGSLKEIPDMTSWINFYTDDVNPGYVNSMVSIFDNFTDSLYFTDKLKGWTLSYRPKLEGFNSFHSFIPTQYLPAPNTFLSINETGMWKHNKIGSYQNYYGEQYPFEVGMVYFTPQTKELQSIELYSDWIKYTSPLSSVFNKNKFFDKILIYNNNGSTGFMSTLLKDKNARTQSLIQNAETLGVCEVSHVQDNIYRINKIENNHSDITLPNIEFDSNGFTYSPVNIDYTKPGRRKEDIKGRWFKVHFISDTNNDHKITVQLLVPETDVIHR